MNSQKNIQIKVKNKIINLTNHVGSGGQAEIYKKKDIAFKIYHDMKDAIPLKKIKELQVLDKDHIIKPELEIFNTNGDYIGYMMKLLENKIDLCKIFTNAFWKTNSVDKKDILKLIENMQSTFEYIHSKNILIVDANEFNFLVDEKNIVDPYFIDIDSYQTKSYPANAIQESIMDLHTKGFTELSDWFSFGILCFQLFTGMHPYRGRHPDYSKNDLKKRMKDNISIFNKKVTIPANMRDFNNIPTDYLKWFENIFENGKRVAPPNSTGVFNATPVKIKVVDQSDAFDISFQKEYDEDVNGYDYLGGNQVIFTDNYIYMNGIRHKKINGDTKFLLTNGGKYVILDIVDKKLSFRSSQDVTPLNLNVDNVFISGNTAFVANGDKIVALGFTEMKNIIPNIKNNFSFIPDTTTFYNEFFITNIFNKHYFFIPKIKGDFISMKNIEVKELEKYKIVYAKKKDTVIAVIGMNKKGEYDKFYLKFDENFEKYVYRKVENITSLDINFTVLRDIVISINDDEDIEIFFRNLDKDDVKVIKDSKMQKDITLVSDATTVKFYKGKKIYNISMR